MNGEEGAIVASEGMLPIPRASIDEMKKVFSFINDMKKALMTEGTDYIKQGKKQYTARSGFAKLAMGFGLSDEILEEHEIHGGDGEFIGWRVKVRVWQHKSGRQSYGVGACTTEEDNIQKKEKSTPGRAFHHDTYATAHTRALNRAISNIVGSAEVSAEEMRASYDSARKPVESGQSLVLPEGFLTPEWDFSGELKAQGWDHVDVAITTWIADSGLDENMFIVESDRARAILKTSVYLGDSFGDVSRMLAAAGFIWRPATKGWVMLRPEGIE